MTNKEFLSDIKKRLEGFKPGTPVGTYTYKGINRIDSFGSPGGRWDPKDYPAFELESGNKRYLLRLIPKYDKLVIEALHLSTMLINYRVNNNNFIVDKNNIKLLENYKMTVRHGRSFDEVEKAMIAAGMSGNIILEQNSKKLDLNTIVDSLFTWADYRQKAKEIIRNGLNTQPTPTIPTSGTKATNTANMTPLNQILFGPPGTGKTYNTINKALEIIGEKLDGKSRKEITTLFKTKIKENQIVFTTFHQSMSYEDFIEGIKPVENKGNVTYEITDGIFKQLCLKASGKSSTDFSKAYDSFIKLIDGEEYFELKTKTNKSFWVSVNSNANLNIFTTEAKNFQGTMIKDRLQRFADGENVFIGWEGYAAGVVNHLKQKFSLSENKEDNTQKKFVIIIDEINRGNVSQIFGELITLIEKDKRAGKDEELEIMLPYSKKKISVPPNVFIVGTMNTADRSVEALDAALRRRFSFEEMPPKYELEELQYEYAGIKVNKILQTINKRIEKLLDKDHAIGHSYFILKENDKAENKIPEAFYRNIIPLLQEYFYGDYGKIGLVLGKGFVRKKDWDKNNDAFAEFDYESSSDFDDRDVFEIIDYTNPAIVYSLKIKQDKVEKTVLMNFEKALKLLINAEID